MGGLIGDLLAPAVGVAVSPLPIIATILMLLAPGARGKAVAFLCGWVVGIAVATTVFTLLGSVLPDQDDSGAAPVAGTIKVVVGVLLLLLTVRQWRSRPGPDDEPALPPWMSAMDTMRPFAAFGLAAALAAVNPKNLLLAASAGITLSAAGVGAAVIGGVVFVVLAASTVLVPVVGYLVAAERLRPALDGLRTWLTANNATIMAVLLLILGVSAVGNGIGMIWR